MHPHGEHHAGSPAPVAMAREMTRKPGAMANDETEERAPSHAVNSDRWCDACRRDTSQFIGHRVAQNGSVQCCWWCRKCESYAVDDHGSVWIPHSTVRALGAEPCLVPSIERRTRQQPFPFAPPAASVKCRRCGVPGAVEEHHWAPRWVFGDDADNWPTDMLCPVCHREWHAKMDARRSA
jgi:hypothetical protein